MNELEEKRNAVKYFLGELSGRELEAFEERFFLDPEFIDFLDEVETDLIDEFVRDELTTSEKQNFEKNYLISERRQKKIVSARALVELEKQKIPVTAQNESVFPVSFGERIKDFFRIEGLAYAFSALVIAVLAGAVWFGFRKKEDEIAKITPTPNPIVSPTPIVSTPNPITSNTNSGNNSGNTHLPPKPIIENRPTPEIDKTPRQETKIEVTKPVIATFLLTGGSLRGNDEIQKLRLPPEAKIVVLKMVDEQFSKFRKFQIQIKNEDGTNILTRQIIKKTNSKDLAIEIPPPGQKKSSYKLTIKGENPEGESEPVNIYHFLIEKK